MRKKVLLFVLASLLMPMCISTSAQEADSAFLKLFNFDSIGTKEVYPKDLGIVTNDSYRTKMMEYAPEGVVCGYIMRNSWNKNLWGIFLVKEGRKYSVVYKEADKTDTRSIKASLAKELEASVNKRIADTETAATTPVTVTVYKDIPEVVMVYEGNYAFAVTPDKAVYSWANSSIGKYNGIDDEIWQKEKDQFEKR